jgi:predicted TIM-barrel fold metal-dependent hydrolase
VPIIDCYTFFGASPRKPADWGLPTLLRIMDEAGVARALACSLKGLFYDFAEGNDETLAACEREPRLLPVATIDPRRRLGCEEEVERLTNRGCRAFRFFPRDQGWPLDFLPFIRLAHHIEDHGGLVFVPCRDNGAATQLLRLLGNRPLALVLCEVGYWNFAEALACARETPNFFLETHLLDSPDALDLAAEAIGPERLLLGTNAPETSPGPALSMIRNSRLSDEAKSLLLGGNISRLLGLQDATG